MLLDVGVALLGGGCDGRSDEVFGAFGKRDDSGLRRHVSKRHAHMLELRCSKTRSWISTGKMRTSHALTGGRMRQLACAAAASHHQTGGGLAPLLRFARL